MRQSGILAAAGLIALKDMTKRLHIDHENALYLAEKLSEIEGIKLNISNVKINMVFFDINDVNVDSEKLVQELFTKGVKINGAEDGLMRFVTNNDVSKEDLDYTIDCIRKIIA